MLTAATTDTGPSADPPTTGPMPCQTSQGEVRTDDSSKPTTTDQPEQKAEKTAKGGKGGTTDKAGKKKSKKKNFKSSSGGKGKNYLIN